MKIKGVIEDLKIKKNKKTVCKNSNNMSRPFSGVFVGIVG